MIYRYCNIKIRKYKYTCKIYGTTLLASDFSLMSRGALGTDGKGASVKISFTTLNRITSSEI